MAWNSCNPSLGDDHPATRPSEYATENRLSRMERPQLNALEVITAVRTALGEQEVELEQLQSEAVALKKHLTESKDHTEDTRADLDSANTEAARLQLLCLARRNVVDRSKELEAERHELVVWQTFTGFQLACKRGLHIWERWSLARCRCSCTKAASTCKLPRHNLSRARSAFNVSIPAVVCKTSSRHTCNSKMLSGQHKQSPMPWLRKRK